MNAAYQWVVDAIPEFKYDVGSLIPPVFESYARVFHPAYRGGQTPADNGGTTISWHAVAEANGRVAHPAMEWGSIVGSWSARSQPGLWDRPPNHGRLPTEAAEELSRVLQQCSGVKSVMYALWRGYAGIEIDSAELFELPLRPMAVINGSIDDATEPFGIPGRTANLWWATDHQWCVATDIDLLTTYVGGSAQCMEAIAASSALEAVLVTSTQRITWDADTLNPLPDPPGGVQNPV